jgi:hypothetical protein
MNKRVIIGLPVTFTPSTQVCSKCQIDKPSTAYYRRPFTRSGLASICLECTAAKAKADRMRRAQRQHVTK